MMKSRATISVIIPARNEESYIEGCLESIQSSAKDANLAIEYIVVLNRCTDQTEQIARSFGASIVRENSKNLSIIRNKGVRAASSDLIVTIDADSRMSSKLLGLIHERMTSGNYSGGGCMIYTERTSLGIVATGIMIMPFLFFSGISVGCFYFTKEAFEAVGGFNVERTTAEDIYFAKDLRRWARRNGKRYSNIYSAYITTSCRKFDEFGDWYMVKNPLVAWRLFRGRDQALGDRFWYDVDR